MSKLKISDISFCETELQSNSNVQGGLGIYSIYPSFYIQNQQPTFSVDSGTSKTDVSRYLIKDQGGNVVGAGGTIISTSDNGFQQTASASAFSFVGNFSQ